MSTSFRKYVLSNLAPLTSWMAQSQWLFPVLVTLAVLFVDVVLVVNTAVDAVVELLERQFAAARLSIDDGENDEGQYKSDHQIPQHVAGLLAVATTSRVTRFAALFGVIAVRRRCIILRIGHKPQTIEELGKGTVHPKRSRQPYSCIGQWRDALNFRTRSREGQLSVGGSCSAFESVLQFGPNVIT